MLMTMVTLLLAVVATSFAPGALSVASPMLTAQPLANPSAVVLCDATLRLTVRTLGAHICRTD